MAYLAVPLLSSSILVNAICAHTDGVRIKKNDRCQVGKKVYGLMLQIFVNAKGLI